ncbi:MAG: hypothetical protein ACK4KX_03270 [Parvibaculum sp.]|uniref:hypothetical protein n=1 Tax=Parvibaculum sp. TaxID=2024848 RepID=UPI00391DC8EC
MKVTLFHPYTDEIAAMIEATAPLDFPVGDLRAEFDAGRLSFAVAENNGAIVAAVAFRMADAEIEIVGLNAAAAPFAIRALWEKLEAYAIGSDEIARIVCMIERKAMQAIVEIWGMKPRAVMYLKSVA